MLEIKENIHCFQYMFFYIYLIFSIIYLSVLFKNLPEESDMVFLIKVMDYWKQKPIWSISPVNEEKEGPPYMEKYSVGIWNGITEGCNCSTSNYDYYLKGSCSNKKYANIKEVNPINIYDYYFKYYVSYYDSDYLTLLSRVDKDTYRCKYGYKKCGSLDNLFHPFCVKEDENCVINHFYFDFQYINKNGTYFIYYGFNRQLINSNFAINNLFINDSSGCIIDKDYLSDEFILYKNKTKKKENVMLRNHQVFI